MDYMATIIANALATTGVIGLVAYLTRTWIKVWIKHEYDMDLEEYKSDLAAANAIEIEKFKAVAGAKYNIITANLLRYNEKQFELYNELWASLCDLESCVAILWDNATNNNLQRLANQVYDARINIKKSALLIEDRHYFELNHILDKFEDFRFGKKSLIQLRKSNQNEHVDPQDIINAIERNAAIKDNLVESLEEMMTCLKRQIIKTEDPNNCVNNGSDD